MQVQDALGAGIVPNTLKARLWTGDIAPLLDTSPGVCAVLDLKAVAGAESAGACGATTKMQIVYILPSGVLPQGGTLTLRPSSIVTA